MTHRFETTLYELFNNTVRYMKAQPLNLGGYAAYSGGDGGPPGGFQGYIPQTRVAYDYSEEATLSTPVSGASLLDNLNHIRYRVNTLWASGNAGIDVAQDGIVIASGIHVVNFVDNFEVELDGTSAVVSLLTTGTPSDASYSGVIGESLTSQITGIADHFTVANVFHDDSLAVYLNGVRQSSSTFIIDGTQNGFTTSFVPVSGDTLTVDYEVVGSGGQFHTHHQYALADDVYTKEEIAYLLQGFSRTVNQEMVFTVAGSGTIVSGLIPTRIWAHDVNDGATISEIMCGFNTPPAGEVRVNVLKNGNTIFNVPSYVTIASGMYTGSRTTGFYDDNFVKDDYFQMKIEKGDTVGADLTVHIRFSYLLD